MSTEKKRVLIITQEMKPYTALSEISEIARKLPQYAQESGMEIRVLMPRFGTINERRHRLHEVVRLSGMNIIVEDDDFPLIIKVASLPGTRMQVYFLDNEEFFKRKSVFEDKEGNLHEDNTDRMIFFCRGALETVKKFGWKPDVIHCHGWMTSLVPYYLKSLYKDDPIFEKSKTIYSVYDYDITTPFNDNFRDKVFSEHKGELEGLEKYKNGDGVNLHKGAAEYADGIIFGSEYYEDEEIPTELGKLDTPILDYKDEEEYLPSYINFYKELIAEEEE